MGWDKNLKTASGRVVADAEIFEAGSTVGLRVRVATTPLPRRGEEPVSIFTTVTYFGEYSRTLAPKLTKGVKVDYHGEESKRLYTDKNGVEREGYEVKALIPLTPYEEVDGGTASNGAAPRAQSQTRMQAQRAVVNAGRGRQQRAHSYPNPQDGDDLPFPD